MAVDTEALLSVTMQRYCFHDSLLCLDALVEEGDLDEDYRLRFGEFSRLMDANYVPSNKRKPGMKAIATNQCWMVHQIWGGDSKLSTLSSETL